MQKASLVSAPIIIPEKFAPTVIPEKFTPTVIPEKAELLSGISSGSSEIPALRFATAGMTERDFAAAEMMHRFKVLME